MASSTTTSSTSNKKPTTSLRKPPSTTSSPRPTLSTGPISTSNSTSSSRPTSRPSSPVKVPGPPKDLASLIGLPLRLTIVGTGGAEDRELDGALWTYDSPSGFAAIASPSPSTPTKLAFTLIKSTCIKSVKVLSSQPDASLPFTSLSTPLPPISTSLVERRLAKAIEEDVKVRARKGVDVSEEAQLIFDALERTLPVRWDKDKIIVMDVVVISSPYGVEDVKGVKGSTEAVERVKMMLDGEKRRREERMIKQG